MQIENASIVAESSIGQCCQIPASGCFFLRPQTEESAASYMVVVIRMIITLIIIMTVHIVELSFYGALC